MEPLETTSPSIPRRIGGWLLRLAGLFVLLEPIWMLLPFAGFLYGSVLRIENLNRSPHTAWLTHFVFPVLTFGLLGPVMVVLGLLVFCVGAGQIYTAKFRRSGLVRNGLYRFVRHPQYIALTLFGGGLLLTWGRAIMFIAFFVMMFLYYYLAKSEERNCVRLFGEDYLKYRECTSFIFPGDRLLRPLGAKLALGRLPPAVRVLGTFGVTMLICFGLMWLIDTAKRTGQTVPYLTGTVAFEPAASGAPTPAVELVAGESGGISFVRADRVLVTRGPDRNASATGFAERVMLRMRQSESLREFLAFLDQPGKDVLVVFSGPYERPDGPGTPGMHAGGAAGGRGPTPAPHGSERVRLVMFRCSLMAEATMVDALADRTKRKIRAALMVPVNLAQQEDIVEGEIFQPGPRFAQDKGEERWDFFARQSALQAERASSRAAVVVSPGAATGATFVLVRGPVLRTRLDHAFAEAIRDRLAASGTFRDQLRKSGCGGDVLAIAFPRPGPNWYRAHHGDPQLSIFVMVAKRRGDVSLDAVISGKQRDLLSAFTVDLDFAIELPADCVQQLSAIGLRRDLEERWEFFTSGVGDTTLHLHRH